jgi:FHS family glucose/mannose:H+ symporter-like MFS transporter
MFSRKLVFSSACLGMLIFGIGLITLGSVATGLSAKFQLDEIAAGTLFSILPIGVLAGSLAFGPICDRYGYKILLSISCIIMFAGFEGIAFAGSTAILKVCIFFFGLSGGAINGATNALVSDISEKEKGANLSLLGVFFGIGALGMPFVSGLLKDYYSFETILSAVGCLTLLAGIFFSIIKFPAPKHRQGFPISSSISLLKDPLIILIAFFLFCQSSFEAIINNWTTTYLNKQLAIPGARALYALSLFVAGMTLMRLLLGSVFRSIPASKMLFFLLGLVFLGCMILKWAGSFGLAVTGLIFLGAGLAGGFPIMLGLVGSRYAQISGTAFSLVLVVALFGNMLVNYLMGFIAQSYGIQHLLTVSFVEIFIMLLLGFLIFRKIK